MSDRPGSLYMQINKEWKYNGKYLSKSEYHTKSNLWYIAICAVDFMFRDRIFNPKISYRTFLISYYYTCTSLFVMMYYRYYVIVIFIARIVTSESHLLLCTLMAFRSVYIMLCLVFCTLYSFWHSEVTGMF